jgi:hypothetical protein
VNEEEWMVTMAKAAKEVDRVMRSGGLVQWERLEYGKLAFESWLRAHPCPRTDA